MNHSDDFIKALTSPDRRFGEVPFYWWNGGELNKERLSKQLKQLAEKGLKGVQINYAHINGGGEDNLPHGGHGKSIEGTPPQFSDEWWEFFRFAAKECEKLDLTIGMGDYTIAWIGNGYFADKVANTEGMNATVLTCENKLLFSGDETTADEDTLAIVTYKDYEKTQPLIIYEKEKGILNPISGIADCFIIKTKSVKNSISPLNPRCGKLLIEYYFEEFFRRCPDVNPKTFDCFFQDELMFGVDTKYLWDESLREGIKEKYSYDILGFIPHLFFNIGNITPKIRLDCADVKTSLIEKNYFIPIFEYHNSRGMIYGCDQSGRGKVPDEFSDYFRTVRWFTAPGNDTPGRAADLIKVKVNASIAHLYNRPRVWLEGYHSSGWGTTLESITAPTSDNFIFGANLLNLHGLYYSTDGGFFEWAPPDFHFRMPYWDDEKQWLDKYKRLSAILTTGKHRADAAIYYPVSSCDYGENSEAAVEATFSLAAHLFNNGVDFDFIDFQSVENAVCENELLKTPEEGYRVLIFAGVDCIRFSALKKAKELLEAGGKVIFFSITPFASDNKGLQDKELNDLLSLLLSHKNCILAATNNAVLSFINTNVKRSFLPDENKFGEKSYVHTRIHGDCTLYFTRYNEKGSICRFEATGNAYLLDIENGEIIHLKGTKTIGDFTYIKMPLEKDEDTLILFTNDMLDYEKETDTLCEGEEAVKNVIELEKDWDFSIIPTLDNTYGDYYFPEGGMIKAQASFFDVWKGGDISTKPEFCAIPYNRSKNILKISGVRERKFLCDYIISHSDILKSESFTFEGTEYKITCPELDDRYYYEAFSYRESLYEQGHHGLKGKVYDDNLYFDDDCLYFTYVYSPEKANAILLAGDIKPEFIILNGNPVSEGMISLNSGKNLLAISYSYDKALAPNYRNNCDVKRTSVHIVKENYRKNTDKLCVSSFSNPDYYRFSKNEEETDIFCFRFKGVPALKGFTACLRGKLLKVLNNNKEADIQFIGNGSFGANAYSVTVKNICDTVSEIVLFVEAEKGYEYTGIIPEPIKLSQNKGKMDCGDLCLTGALMNFSGKAVYEKTVNIQKLYPDERFYIDIEDAATTLNIEINGKTAAVFTHKPFYKDITPFVINGENRIKITVSNTLCNHYSTIPSKYSNFPKDASWGLLKSVKIITKEKSF